MLTRTIYYLLGWLHEVRGEYATAEAESRHLLDLARPITPTGSLILVNPLCQLSAVLGKEGKRAEAQALYQEAREIYDRREEPSFETDLLKTWLGEALTGLGRYAEAEGLLQESYADLRGRVGEQNFYTTEARRVLRELYEARHEPERAAQYAASQAEPGR